MSGKLSIGVLLSCLVWKSTGAPCMHVCAKPPEATDERSTIVLGANDTLST